MAAVFVAWELAALNSEVIELFIPPPSKFFPPLVSMFLDGIMPLAIYNTLRKAFHSYSMALATAIPIGVLLGWKSSVYKIFEPIVEALRPIPSIALIAPAIIFFGLGDNSVQFVAYYAVFWVMFINSLYGIYGVDKLAMMAFRSMHAKDRDIFLKLMLPSALPFIFAGMRQALAVSMIVTVAGEMIAGSRGLGYFLLESERSFHYESVYAALIVLSFLGYLLNRVFLTFEGKVLKWTKETTPVT
ncbi:MAG: ABC transporter permease [Candidatus Caldarchaeum sp.]